MARPKKPQATRAAFLQHYEETGRVNLACQQAGIGKRTHYNWLERDRSYSKQFEKSRKIAIQLLEDEAMRRAVEGIEKAVTIAGERETVREYSDTLLIFLLKGAFPEKYRERYTAEVQGTVTHAIEEGLAARIIASRRKRQLEAPKPEDDQPPWEEKPEGER